MLTDIKNRLQFVIVLFLFFPVIIEALFNLGSSQFDPDQVVLQWGGLIALLLLNYIFIETSGDKLSLSSQKWIGNLLLYEIVPFIFILYATASVGSFTSSLFFIAYSTSLLVAMIIPMIIVFWLAIAIIINDIRKRK